MQYIHARFLRQAQIKHNRIVGFSVAQMFGINAVISYIYGEACFDQITSDVSDQFRIVFDD